jgi:toxin YhaV
LAKAILHFPDGAWKALLGQTFKLLDDLAQTGIPIPKWSLGGGTVLIFYYQHRKSKDIDIFVLDPQFLGYVNPRLGGPAESLTSEYTDAAEYVKLFMPQGEIDFVAAPPLTANPFEELERNANIKLFRALSQLILEVVPSNPALDEIRQDNTLGTAHRHWRRAKIGRRFRLFFRYDAKVKVIVFAWVNDEQTLRAAESKSDPYAVFEKMLNRGNPPDDWGLWWR